MPAPKNPAPKPEERAQSEAVASAQGAPIPATPAPAPEPDVKAVEQVNDVSATLGDLDRDTLLRLNSAVDAALRDKGQDAPGVSGPALDEIVSNLPTATDHDYSFSQIASAAGADESKVIGYNVRQAHGPNGKGIGPAYASVVLSDGSKTVAAL